MAEATVTETPRPRGPRSPSPSTDGPAPARPGELLISAAERAGTYIPRFCYHPRMKPVGMCRMCLVEVSGPRGATLQPACFIAATEGMEVVTDSDKVKKAQDGVLEFLLVNHPLDCPVCDKGGECPLQDQTLAYGPGESRFVEEKRHFAKPVAISDLVLLGPRALHPVRPLHPLRRGGGRGGPDRLRRTGRAGRGGHLPRRALLLVLQRQHRADLPGRRAHRHPLPLHRPALGPRPGGVDLHHLRARVPGGGPVVGQPADPAAGHRRRPGQPGLALRQGPVRLRGGQRRRGAPPAAPPRPARCRGRRRVGAGGAVRRRGRRDRPPGARTAHRAHGPQGRRAGRR